MAPVVREGHEADKGAEARDNEQDGNKLVGSGDPGKELRPRGADEAEDPSRGGDDDPLGSHVGADDDPGYR